MKNVARTIVITGAGIGLGRAVARRLAADGDTLILLGRTLSKVQDLATELGGNAMAVECDVSSADSVKAAFATIASQHPKIDVLINNAAIYEPFDVVDGTDEQILGSLLTNLAGPIFACRAAIPMMDRGAHIINVSSESAVKKFPMLSLYQASKAGLERFSETLLHELAPSAIRVTVVRAGPMYEEGKGSSWPMEVAMKFAQQCAAIGLDLRGQPISHVNSVAEVFHHVVNLPADVHMPLVHLEGFRA
jgi:3-oxoacyl-[acyl-carrier protein] reductase